MTASAEELNKKFYIKCDGKKCGGGLFTYDGYQQIVYRRQVDEHRQNTISFNKNPIDQ
jgi:hypothetical protein